MRMLDLFCGRWGWSKAFSARGWECVGVDLVHSPEFQPQRAIFVLDDALNITVEWIRNCGFDFICASSPCEQFSVHGMKHFHPNPPYPELGIKLFNHTREICEASGIPYIMENVRAAQQFVGNAKHHCGPFYLWGSGVPPLMAQGIRKNLNLRNATGKYSSPFAATIGGRHSGSKDTAHIATIPPELANCVADYAEAICHQPNAV